MKCEKHDQEMECLAGCSAHPGNWYCPSCEAEAEAAQVEADVEPEAVAQTGTLPRYGLEWSGPKTFVTTELDDGYWTPWHLANAEIERLQVEVETQAYWGPKWEQEHARVEQQKQRIADLEKALDELKRYFTSGNDVPVQRATIDAETFWQIVGN